MASTISKPPLFIFSSPSSIPIPLFPSFPMFLSFLTSSFPSFPRSLSPSSLLFLLFSLLFLSPTCSARVFIKLEIDHPILGANVTYIGEQAAFGPALPLTGLKAYLFLSDPPEACTPIEVPPALAPVKTDTNETIAWVALILRGICNFETKVMNAQNAGASFAIIYNNVSNMGASLIVMSAGPLGGTDVKIPSAFISRESGVDLLQIEASRNGLGIPVTITSDAVRGVSPLDNHWAVIVFIGILAILISSFFIMIFLIVEIYRQRRRRRHRRRPKPVPIQVVITLPLKEIAEEDLGEDKNVTCAVCLDDYEVGNQVRQLPCRHEFHQTCIDPWLMKHNHVCPVCKQDIEKGIEMRKILEDGKLGEVIELDELNRPSTSTYSQRDSTAGSILMEDLEAQAQTEQQTSEAGTSRANESAIEMEDTQDIPLPTSEEPERRVEDEEDMAYPMKGSSSMINDTDPLNSKEEDEEQTEKPSFLSLLKQKGKMREESP